MEEISINEFARAELRVCTVTAAEKVEGADKLMKMQVSLGDETRQIVAGIAQHYAPEALVGKQLVLVANLQPAVIRGVESRGMILAASDQSGIKVLTVDSPVDDGSRVK